jgi:hypothetical protein
LVEGGRLAGFIAVRRTTIRRRHGLLSSGTVEDVVRWRVALSPDKPWDEGYQELEDAERELSEAKFAYVGKDYVIQWADPDVSAWILRLVLTN